VQRVGEARLSASTGRRLDGGGVGVGCWLDRGNAGAGRRSDVAVQGLAQRATESGRPRVEPDWARARQPARWRVGEPNGRSDRSMEEPGGHSSRTEGVVADGGAQQPTR
jgi:hypothetical protein